MVTEFCEHGNLLDYLIGMRYSFVDELVESTRTDDDYSIPKIKGAEVNGLHYKVSHQ